MALPSIVQDSGTFQVAVGVVSLSFTLPSVSAGSTLVSTIAKVAAEARTFTCTDNVDANAYAKVEAPDGANKRDAIVFWDIGVTGGNTMITQTSSSSSSWYAFFYELADVDALDISDSFTEEINSTTHPASSTGITTASDVAIITSGTSSKAIGSVTAAPDFSLDDSGASGEIAQHLISSTSRVLEKAIYTTGGARFTYAAMVSFKGAAGGGGATITLPQIERHYPRGTSRGLCRGLV